MTHTLPNDGLLKAARILITIIQVILGIGFAALLVATPTVIFSQSHIADELAATATANVGAIAISIACVLVLGAAMVSVAYYFLRLLKQMINSVGDGDPFIAENADRLTRMGWLAVSIEGLKIPIGAIMIFITTQLKEEFTIDADFSFTGLLIALVLFILARVFRQGAA
ncbi:MAG: DUF2975 domain-containing protein, partial [Altererythrobacter ishigakiensis]|nr:DUF2975 domain-containing protein [Altererythrobacter ishigakiensis]